MKHLKPNTPSSIDHNDRHVNNSSPSTTHHSTASLNHISMNSHDFELRKRDFLSNDHLSKKLRFFHKRKTKDLLLKSPVQPSFNDDSHCSSIRSKGHSQFFGQSLEELIKRYEQQLPPVIQVMSFLFSKSSMETTFSFSNCWKYFITKDQKPRESFVK